MPPLEAQALIRDRRGSQDLAAAGAEQLRTGAGSRYRRALAQVGDEALDENPPGGGGAGLDAVGVPVLRQSGRGLPDEFARPRAASLLERGAAVGGEREVDPVRTKLHRP